MSYQEQLNQNQECNSNNNNNLNQCNTEIYDKNQCNNLSNNRQSHHHNNQNRNRTSGNFSLGKNMSRDKYFKDKENSIFKSLKDKTHPFFKSSLIESCSHIKVKNGQTLAVPFNIRNSKGKKLSSYKNMPIKSSELSSIYRKDYNVKPIIHAGMLNKPLEPYNPSSYRNRLPNTDVVICHKNKSLIEIGNKQSASRKQWISTYSDTYKTPVFLPICNTGILSDISKKIHKKINES